MQFDEPRGQLAVSPVVAIVLMAAVAVALAGLVFVFVGGDPQAPPPAVVRFQVDEATDRIEVLATRTPVDWSNLRIQGDQVGLEYELNAPADGIGGTPLGTLPAAVTTTSQAVVAGDYLEICGTSGPLAPATISMIDAVANQVLAQLTLRSVAAC